MASTYTLGQNFALLLGSGIELVCKQSSTLSVSNSSVLVRNRCEGDYGKRIAGGQKEGSISFTGDYNSTPTNPNISAFDLFEQLGDLVTAIWGGTDPGEEIITVIVAIDSLEITSDQDSQITFSATLNFAGTPVRSQVTT